MDRGASKRLSRMGEVVVAVATIAVAAWSASANGEPAGRYDLADLKALERAFIELAERVRPSVVAIRTYEFRKPGESDTRVRVPIAHGSGFVIAASNSRPHHELRRHPRLHEP